MEGKLFIHVNLWDITIYFMSIRLTCKLDQSAFNSWQQRTWEHIRSQFRTAFLERRQMLKDRLERLESELGAEDALSLQKIEREEVMKGVLRWIGISDFQFFPEGVPANIETDLYRSDTGLVEDLALTAKMLVHGEIIKFLDHAIEWENMIYFLYPYFWTNANRWEIKMKLDHPDAMHRAFLKAGSARVVLTIRPDFEDAFMAFLNTGDFNGLPPSPYREIGEELKNFARTNYPGIPAANPTENSRPLLYPEQRRAWAEINTLIERLENYKEANAAYPTTSQGLGVLGAGIPTMDPWGNPYVYKSPGQHGDYDLASLGADGAVGGEGVNADITSWAESSQIGQWYEYTPTSAIDIEFNERGIGEEDANREGATAIESILQSVTESLNPSTATAKFVRWVVVAVVVLVLVYIAAAALGWFGPQTDI